MELPYDHDYLVTANVFGTEFTTLKNPKKDSRYSEKTWNSMASIEKEVWLDKTIEKWILCNVGYNWNTSHEL